MVLKKIILYGTFLVASSCGLDENLCELNKSEQQMLDKANKIYTSILAVKRIPCEGIYIRVELQNNPVNDSIIIHLHKILYDSTTNHGWQTLWVYDRNGVYLFSHSSTGKKYQQSGD